MKRSEFIEKLYIEFDKWMDENPYSNDNIIDVIIRKAEELGMEPPYTGNGFTQGNYWDKE